MEYSDDLQALLRWAHIVAGVLWIGLLYFFNFVNGPFAATLDKDTKPKVVPELLPRALYWFRWGAAWTWVTGFLLMGLVYYMAKSLLFEAPQGTEGSGWSAGSGIMVLLTFLGFLLYDVLEKSPLGKKNQNFAILSLVLVAVVLWAYGNVAGFSYRATNIHLGAMFGTMMAFNVWFRIWPAQQKIITAVKGAQAPDAALVAMAGARSRHNTYMSVPLVFAMINQHTTGFSNQSLFGLNTGFRVWTLLAVALGWLVVMLLYKKAAKVKGF
jgi:uncharacterized membrane protein